MMVAGAKVKKGKGASTGKRAKRSTNAMAKITDAKAYLLKGGNFFFNSISTKF